MAARSLRSLLCAIAFPILIPLTAAASSHSEAPGSALVRDLDLTDLYVFRSPDAPDTVTFVVNTYPFQEPGGGPNFYRFSDEGLYEIRIDNNGDAIQDITFQFRFRSSGPKTPSTWLYNTGPLSTIDDADFNRPQFYTLTRIEGRGTRASVVLATDLAVPPVNIGPKSTPDYAALSNAGVHSLAGNIKVFAGQADDPFFVDLGAIFDLGTLRPLANLHTIPPIASGAETAYDYVRGFNVNAIVLQVPISSVTRSGSEPIIGVWAASLAPRVLITTPGRRQGTAGFTQVSRLGTPLVNEVVIPVSLKDAFNGLEPSQDFALFNSNMTFQNAILDPELPALYDLLYRIPKAPTPRNDIVAAALTGLDGLNKPANVVPAEMLRINLSTPLTASPDRLGALAGDNQGFPNGRRLADDVTDILLRVFAGVLIPGMNVAPRNLLTDGVDTNDKPFRSTFPYLALAHQGKESRPHP
jgi:hypothetical protein